MADNLDSDHPVEWVSLAEGAQRVGKSTKTLRRAIKDGRLNAQRDGAGDTAPWLISSSSLADVYGDLAEAAADVTAVLAQPMTDVLAMLNDANRIAREAVERAARAEAEVDHLKERLAEQRQERPARWWRR